MKSEKKATFLYFYISSNHKKQTLSFLPAKLEKYFQ